MYFASEFYHSLPSPWQEKDTAWEVKPSTTLYQKPSIIWWPQSRDIPRWAPPITWRQGELVVKAVPENQEHVVAELGGPAGIVTVWVRTWGLLSYKAFQKSGLGRAGCWDLHRLRAVHLCSPSCVSISSPSPAMPAPLLTPPCLGDWENQSDFSSPDENPL